MHPRPPDAIMDEAIRCPCTLHGQPWCPRCECLVELALARDVWLYEQATGQPWKVDMDRRQQETWMAAPRISGLRGLGYSLLGWGACVYALAHCALWVLPKCAWLNWTGQIPPPEDPHTWQTHDKEGKG